MKGAALLEIVSNSQDMTVAVGERIYSRPYLWPLPERDLHLKEDICGAAPFATKKDIYKFYASRLGTQFNRRFRAAHYWLWLGNRMRPATANMLRIGGKKWNIYSEELVVRANEVLRYVHEAEADELHQLIPAIVVFKASPQEIRREVGPATWRRIAHNSRTRNTRIMQTVARHIPDGWPERFVRLLDFPSGVLGSAFDAGLDEQVAARVTPRKTPMAFTHTLHLVRDTIRMLEEDFNPNWSLARIRQEHDQATRSVRKKKFSDKPFADDWSFERDGYSATLLTSKLDIALEGDAQHHCVASYAGLAASGQYAVLRIEGKERATAGLQRVLAGWSVQQVYGACNAGVSEACRAFVKDATRAFSQPLLVAA
jgi:hypothetical protein